MTGEKNKHYQLKQMFQTLDHEVDKKDYFRLEPSIGEAKTAMDNSSAENIRKLAEAGKRYVTEHKDELNHIIDRLIETQ